MTPPTSIHSLSEWQLTPPKRQVSFFCFLELFMCKQMHNSIGHQIFHKADRLQQGVEQRQCCRFVDQRHRPRYHHGMQQTWKRCGAANNRTDQHGGTPNINCDRWRQSWTILVMVIYVIATTQWLLSFLYHTRAGSGCWELYADCHFPSQLVC